ncbi:beta-ketoacyl synthase domain-containing protein [Colletotrichum karsti]|uniref:Beta-ketoacyl synthase domain-containing protein n=1 Tax=Colletotrichum karsti TaxID=1095194 RepID=A0A9P6I049_9PEZI|nr:beta-ketoacyl synthase domain-containing protein [Colletotrichum karsti]KAF9871551.1 beta-ketoacyl synthase domain-containing protein [Colletotrichum karsti]
MEDIAIVGMACRFPGEATSPEKLWDMMVEKKSAWSEFPKDRLNIDGYYHPSGDRQGSISFRGAHFLQDNMAAFDASFFSVMAEDAKAIDPQQRFLLEVSYEALENAGLRVEDLKGSPTAVYVGSFVKDYEQICLRDMDWQPQYAATGTGNAIMANRVSYTYDFKGPSMTLDTGCSGSLVAVHLAAQALRTGDCELALAAGAGLILTPNTMMPMTALNFLSPDGKCFAFDSRANGYGRGEGIGFVVLKKLSHALRDNDTIRAVIRGTHVNQDGLTTGITLPSKEAQVANIRSLYSKYDLDMQQTAFVECHGTGTQAGDFRELKAISETLATDRPTESPIYVGSVKTNIGHLEGAAGVAGLIKGVLLTEKGKIPPNINFEKGNPNIDFEEWKVKVPTDLTEWPVEGLRRVSVNCFGFGGTNAHAVLDEPSSYFSARGILGNHNSTVPKIIDCHEVCVPAPEKRHQLFVFSSNERKGVSRVMSSHLGHISDLSGFTQIDANDYAYTLACRRSILEWKGFVVASDADDLSVKLAARDETSFIRSTRENTPKVAFIFCGQGSQWAQMGLKLMCFDAFRNSLEAAAAHIKKLGSDFDLIEEITRDPGASRIQDPRISQPATTAIQVALVDLLRSFNVSPTSVAGHSSGEIAAAYASSFIDAETAWALAYHRGHCASLLQFIAPQLKGRMCAVRLSSQEAQEYLKHVAEFRDLEIACVNSPISVTISGSLDDILWMRDDLKSRKILCKVLDVDIAYHSRHMKEIEESYKQCIKDIRPTDSPTEVRFFSSVKGKLLPGHLLGPSYWAENLVSPVQFVDAVKCLMNSDNRPDIMVELSPHATLESALSEIIAEHFSQSQLTYLSLLRRTKDSSLTTLEAVGQIWARGHPVNVFNVISKGNTTGSYKTLVNLPSYPWNHSKSFWHESHTCTEHRFRNFGREDLIGAPSPDATTFEPRWRGFFRISENPWLQDHRVQKTIVYPAAGMVTMALQAASQLSVGMLDVIGFEVTNLQIEKAMIIPSTAFGLECSLNLKNICSKPDVDPEWEFSIYSKKEEGAWIRHADGRVRIRRGETAPPMCAGAHKKKHSEIQKLCDKTLPPRQLYEILDVVGLNYGPCFQNVVSISTHLNSCISKVRIPDTKSKMPADFEYAHIIHPATLDSMFQTLFAIDSKPMVPSMIDSIFVSANISHDIGDEFTGYAQAERSGLRDARGSIVMTSGNDGWGSPSVVVEGLHFTALSAPSIEDGGFIPNHRNLCSEIVWKENYATSTTEDFTSMLSLMAHKHASLAVLQCGGNEHLARHVLETLSEDGTSRLSRYTVIDEATFSAVQESIQNTSMKNLVEYRDWSANKETFPSYNVVITANDSNVDQTEASRLLLAEGLVLNEISQLRDDGIISARTSQELSGSHSLQASYELESDNDMSHWMLEQRFEAHFFTRSSGCTSSPGILIVLPDTISSSLQVLISAVIEVFSDKGFAVTASTLSDAKPQGSACVSLLEVCDNFVYNWTDEQFRNFHKLQNEAKSILWVTRAANRKPTDPRNAPVVALIRTILSEDPQKTIVTLDLDENTPATLASLPHVVLTVMESILNGSGETEFAEEEGKLYIPRLMPLKELNKLIESDSRIQLQHQPIFDRFSPKMSYEMIISKPGTANDGFHFIEKLFTSKLGSGEVEIRTLSAALFNDDLQTAMGRTTGNSLGLDVMGIVTGVGSKVNDYRPGDQVLAIVPGAFKSVHRVDHRLVKPAPPPVECCQYSPSIFVAAYYALCTIGRLSSKKTVLIHTGASACGQAAIRIASFIGAETFATVIGDTSGSQLKTLKESHGLPNDHILDADSDSFVTAVLASGKVDVVYNPTQEHTAANLKVVKRSGCVVQHDDKTGTPTNVPIAGTAFIKLDVGVLLQEDPDLVMDIFHDVNDFVWKYLAKSSRLQVEPVHRFPMSDMEAAFKQIEQEPNHGLTMMMAKPEIQVPVAHEIHTKPLAAVIDPHGTYVLAGGLGGLGNSIAKLLADNGAKKLVFLSRSGGSPDADVFFKSLSGVDARAIAVDITDRDALEKIVPDLGKIAGVVQCAAVIKDALFEKMTHDDWTAAFGPKAVGATNLVDVFNPQPSATSSSDPWFLFLSSASGIIGNRGQANYAAANAVQDALAKSGRIARACSLDLGPVLEAGMLVGDEDTLGKLRGAGFYGIRHDDFLEMVSRAITGEIVPGVPVPAQIVSGVGTGGLIRQNNPGDPFWSRTAMYSYMNTVDMPVASLDGDDNDADKTPGEDDVKRMLAACGSQDEAAVIVAAGLVQLMAKAMTLLPEEIDPERAPSAYGVDSLVAVGVRN